MTIQMHPPDEKLWQAIAVGDEAAFTSLFDRHARAVWLALLRRIPAPRPDGGADLADDVAGRLDDERRMAEILAAVRRLPRAEREAVTLCLWSGVSYPDAAAVLGISEVAVRSRVSRARARLARIVGADMEEGR